MVLTVSKSCVAKNASGHLGFQFFTEKRTESLGHFKTFNFKLKTLKNSLNRTLKHLLKNQLKVQKVTNSEKFDDFSKSVILPILTLVII